MQSPFDFSHISCHSKVLQYKINYLKPFPQELWTGEMLKMICCIYLTCNQFIMVYFIWNKNEQRTVSGIHFDFIDVMAVIFNLTTLQSVAAPGNDFI